MNAASRNKSSRPRRRRLAVVLVLSGVLVGFAHVYAAPASGN